MMKILCRLVLLACLTLTVACRQRHESMGKPYTVKLTGNDRKSLEMMENRLTLTFADMLPQKERLFEVETISNAKRTRWSRTVIVVETDAKRYQSTTLTCRRNRWAQPQIELKVTTPSAAHLQHFLQRHGRKVVALLDDFELRQWMEQLHRKHEKKVREQAIATFGHSILVSPELNSFKTGKNFLWTTSPNGDATMNICLYSYPATRLDAAQLLRQRDSIMKQNIPGEQPGMYMQTETSCTPLVHTLHIRGREVLLVKGLWSMYGDIMGGPFVCHAFMDTASHRVIVGEGFVFAPGHRKRNYIKQLEAMLLTIE